jgi:hypothetical protein
MPKLIKRLLPDSSQIRFIYPSYPHSLDFAEPNLVDCNKGVLAIGFGIRDVLLPPDLETNRTRQGSYNIEFQFSHLLHQNQTNPREGWGVFLKAALADGNPNPIRSYLVVRFGRKRANFWARARQLWSGFLLLQL